MPTRPTGARVGWYVRRLQAMEPSEVAWRVRRLASSAAAPAAERVASRRLPRETEAWSRMRDAFIAAEDRPVLLDRGRAQQIKAADPGGVAALVAAAERVVDHRVRYFGYPETRLARPIDWHRDPIRDFDWPRVPASRLDHRTADADPKWIWELNRLQHLPWLAQAWLFTGREEFAREAFEQLDSWLDANPVGDGIAWRGAFEIGVRAISVLVALQGLRDSPLLTTERFRRVAEMLDAASRMCWRERSLFSSANNHLVGEMAGLATIGLLLPELPSAKRWVGRAESVLAREAGLQILPDGAGAEQAVGYHVFTAELLLVALALSSQTSRSRGGTRPLAAALGRSSRYLAGLVGEHDPAPHYGDDDEGFALRLGPEDVRTVRDHLAIVDAYSSSNTPPQGNLTAHWLAALSAQAPPPAELRRPEPLPPSFVAPYGGLAVLRRGGERLTVDVGPLGYLSLAAHGHADALAVTWSVDGVELLGDPGTGSYYGHPDWRTAHRSTPVHATVTVDDEDQSVLTGPFMWSQHAQVEVLESDAERGIVDAQHDGYLRLAEPVTHRRWVQVTPDTPGFVVVDVVRGDGRHRVSVAWPLAPGLGADQVADGHVVRGPSGHVAAQIASAATSALDHRSTFGDEVTHRGWWSERLESRTPSHLLSSTCEGPVPLVIASVVRPTAEETRPVEGLCVELVADEAVVTWHEDGQDRELRLRMGQLRFDPVRHTDAAVVRECGN